MDDLRHGRAVTVPGAGHRGTARIVAKVREALTR
jgi:hypothetical protein